MKKLNLIWTMILLVMAGCGGGNKQSTDAFLTVDVTANYPKKELILQDFLDVEYIPLETNDEFITSANIQSIGKEIMIFRNMNRGANDIFIFDRNGKGLRKINRFGQSGEEYTNVLGITLDEENGEMFVNNHYAGKVLVYDLFGDFKRSFKQRKDFFYDQIGNFDRNHLICHDGYVEYEKKDTKRNFFLIVSKQDGSIKEISIPYKEKKSPLIVLRNANGKIVNDRSIFNRELIPFQDSWILAELSADTIYRYSQDRKLTPFIVRTPSAQTMTPEVFLFPGVLTDRYYFMQVVKKEYDFKADNGFPRTDLVYDRQEKAIFECTVYNEDFANKPMSLVYEIPMFTMISKNEIAFMKRLEAYELVEAYGKGLLKGKLKEIAATLNEDSNAVIMLAKYKK
ncbi:6-bladed beta-propeller [Parabacteroides sp. Marseille-P3160]|jgi:hypothetical protein|uniref:6-bladed beta-propeller n=1 Tax=Parabacteroides sp. Marseille-P3160 TaxID=1917887 RepID=UPI0009B98FCA|nr:6-bladed beta-propeller [Parabacteroides sp. Marseille-P3160]